MRSLPRGPGVPGGVLGGALAAVLAVSAVLALLLVVVPGSAQAAGQAKSRPDNRLDRSTCALLGRVWVDTAPRGCSRTRCLGPSDFIRFAPNAEVCARGGEYGPRFGTFVDSRRCGALHRTWVAVMNVCVSNPFRGRDAVVDGPGCRAPYTTYVTHTEREGDYDECLRPGRVATLQRIADRTGEPFRQVSSDRSRTLCSYRHNSVFRGGVCRPGPQVERTGTSGTLVIGDSVTWRGTDELAALRPDWTVDGLPGRQVYELGDRIEDYLGGSAPPDTVVVALGTNPSWGWTQEDYVETVDALLPATTRVVFVTPYRDPSTANAGVAAALERYAVWMQEAVGERPRTCVADWRTKAMSHPNLLIDGTHQTTPGERAWARFIVANTDACVAANP